MDPSEPEACREEGTIQRGADQRRFAVGEGGDAGAGADLWGRYSRADVL